MLRSSRTVSVVLVTTWLAAVGTGMFVLVSYANTSGSIGPARSEWPTDCFIQPDGHRRTMVMFVHPHCPCSRASLAELARIQAQTGDRLNIYVLFFEPPHRSPGWLDSGLWTMAASIPGVQVVPDAEAATASMFGAKTSGHVMLYDVDGRLRFSGGITAGRGHEGDNAGRSAIVSLVRDGRQASTSCPAYGCPISE